ncbi:hypothetical protein M9H77_03296 [Catharanthus roseus]|uniref:Uncharacterized protein n=1 Tax=Catharanthus roseus TaxID=4058 RepID=A0ACC0CB99_CATRO|nr:hypothetical protein M9H77_03296 [Catharanthus roseus]
MKGIVVLEKSEKVNFYTNGTNSFFTSESLCVQNFEDSSNTKEESLLTRIEDKGRSIEKELCIYLEDLPMSPFLNPFLSFHEVSFEELKSLLNFENKIEANLEMLKVNILAFEKSILRKEAFEQLAMGKRFFHHLPFKDVDINLFFDLQDFFTLTCVTIGEFLKNMSGSHPTISNRSWVKE